MLATEEPASLLPLWLALGAVVLLGGFWLIAWPCVLARLLKAPASFGELAAMRVRCSPIGRLLRAFARARRAGLDMTLGEIEAHHLAGGRPGRLVKALALARRHGLSFTEAHACALDILGQDVPGLVESAIHPTSHRWPPPTDDPPYLRAIARDGVEVRARLSVEMRTCFERYIGGVPDETVLLRMGDMLIKTIAAAPDHRTIVTEPDRLIAMLKVAALDQDAAVEVLDVRFEFLAAEGA